MAIPRLELPAIQNWSCHHCGDCCRHHSIEVTDEERKRIEAQRWTRADGISDAQNIFVPLDKPKGKMHHRLAHQGNGACVFFDSKGLCRIHTKFGEDAKPLACRIFPYAFHPAGKKVVVSLRFSCPSAAANRGKPVSQQAADIKKIAEAVVPEGVEKIPAPPIIASAHPEWPDFLRFIARLDVTLAEPNVPVAVKLLRALFWLRLVEKAQFDNVAGADLDEILNVLAEAAKDKVPANLDGFSAPGRIGKMLFRTLVVQYARHDTVLHLESVGRHRWNLLRAAMKFSAGVGNTPPLQDVFKPVKFSSLEKSFGGIPDEVEEIFTRYFRVKIQGIHFCGAACYNLSLIEGFRNLALIFPVALWLARWLAASDGRDSLQTHDVARAISIADHHHGYSPALGSNNSRLRVRVLSRFDDIGKLCAWYGR